MPEEEEPTRPRMMYKFIKPEGAAQVRADFERARGPGESLEQTVRRLLPNESEEVIRYWLAVADYADQNIPDWKQRPILSELDPVQAFKQNVESARKPGETTEQVIRRLSPKSFSQAEIASIVSIFEQYNTENTT